MNKRLLAVLILLLPACSDPRADAQKQLHEIGIPRLRYDAALLYKQLYAGPTADYIPLKPSQWPPSFRQLAPRQIGATREGFTFTLSGKASSESGLHICPTGMTTTPHATHAHYERLEDGIYWYSISK